MKRREIEVSGVFDIETESWDQFVVGGVCWNQHGEWNTSVFWHDRESDFVDRLLQIRGTLWAHSGGRYDALWLLDHLIKRGEHVEINLAGQRIVRLKTRDLEIRDSFALIPFALKLAATMGGGEKLSTGLRCTCERDCGGYCAIKRSMDPASRRELETYLRGDLACTRDMLLALIQFAREHDLDLMGTIGSSAYRTAARRLNLPRADWNARDYMFARSAYFGGRTQVFRPRSAHGYRCDVNSAYIAALSKLEVPIGKPFRALSPHETTRYYDRGLEGILEASVFVPPCHIPPLPVRIPSRIAYPVGKFVGTWTALELRAAVERGARILSVGKSLWWRERAPLFRDFTHELWDIRASVGPRTAFGQWIKWKANSFTGKTAQHPIVDTVEINPDLSDELKFCPADFDCHDRRLESDISPCCAHRCNGLCGVWKAIDRNNKVWTKKEWRIADCAHVQWAAYLTAYERIYLLDQLCDDGQDGWSAVYCDTDSCYSEIKRTYQIGLELGWWKDEGEYWDFLAVAPKTYRYRSEEGEEAKAKGIPNAIENWYRLREGVPIDRGVLSFKAAARAGGGLFVRQHMERHVKGSPRWYGDRILEEGAEATRAPTMVDLHELTGKP